MVARFEAVVSTVLVLAGVVSIYEYTLYTAEQKAAAPRLATAYLASSIAMVLVGFGGFAVAVLGPNPQWYLMGAVGLVAGISVVVQNRFNRRLGLDTGPLVARLTED